MGAIVSGKTWAPGETVTPAKLNQQFDDSTLAGFGSVTVAPTQQNYSTGFANISSTAPTITDGHEVLSQIVTPAAASTKILILHSFGLGGGGVNQAWWALFRGTTLIACRVGLTGTSNNEVNISLLDSPGSASPVTYSLRIGKNGSTDGSASYVSANSLGGGERAVPAVFLQIPG